MSHKNDVVTKFGGEPICKFEQSTIDENDGGVGVPSLTFH
jgi:hypothetical protein